MSESVVFIYLSLVVGYFACFGSLFVTAWVRDVAESRDFVDRPDGGRKSHKAPVALGGGVAILISTAIAIGMVAYIFTDLPSGKVEGLPSLIGLAIAAVLLCGVGLYDDLYNMRGVIKLLWQLVAACIIVALGPDMVSRSIVVLGYTIEMHQLGFPLAIIWILAAVNSLNLIDGMDGLATSVGLIFSFTIGIMALMTGQWLEAIIAFAMAGSLLGFLRHNWTPAKIYLGDSGSMLIGIVLGTLALRCQVKDATSIAVATPLAIFAIPFIDSAAALMRRKLTGRSLYVTDRGHIHHRLLTQNFSNHQALFLIAGLCALTCTGSVLGMYFRKPFGVIAFGMVLAILIGFRLFGHSELMLLNNRIAGFGRRFLPGSETNASSVRLQGTIQWEEAWDGLVEAAEKFNLMKIRLNLYLPRLHEDFFATWQRRSTSRTDRRWSVELPLVVDNTVVGTLSVSGVQDGGSVAPSLTALSDIVEPLEMQLESVLEHHRLATSAPVAPDESAAAPAEPIAEPVTGPQQQSVST